MSHYLEEMAKQGYNPMAIGAFHRFMVPWLLRTHGVPYEASILDIGAGQGHTSVPLHDSGWSTITVLDISETNFGLFRDRYGFSTIRCDASSEAVPLADGTFDAVICFHVIEHMQRADTFMSEVSRVLKPGGWFFLVTPDWRKSYRTFWADPTHLRPYDKVSIARLFRMYNFEASVHSWNARFGAGRFQFYRFWPRLGMIGSEMLAVGRKPIEVASSSIER